MAWGLEAMTSVYDNDADYSCTQEFLQALAGCIDYRTNKQKLCVGHARTTCRISGRRTLQHVAWSFQQLQH